MPALVALASGLALIASMGLPARATPIPRPERVGVLSFVRRPGVPSFLLAVALLHAAHASYDLTFSLRLRELGMDDRWVGPTWAIGVAAEVAVFSLVGRMNRVGGHETLLLIAALGGAARWSLLAVVQSASLAAWLQPLHAISFGCMWLGATGFVAERAPRDQLASAQGTFTACAAAGNAAGMLACGSLHASHGGRAVFGAAALLALLAAVPAWATRRAR